MEMEGLTMAQFTRRHVLAGAAGLALIGTNRAKAEDLPPHEKELYEPAKREGELTWYSGQLSAETSEAVGRAFTERFPGVKVNVVRSTSQVAFQRLSQDMRAGAPQCDVFASTDFGHYSFLKRQNALLQFRPRNADGLLDSVKTADPDNYYQTAYLGIYLLAYNTQKVAEADAPKAWQDVLDPRWKDQLAVGHPGYSGAILTANLTAGQIVARFNFPPAFPANLNPRFLSLLFTPVGTFTGGVIASAIVTMVRDDQSNRYAAKNYSVA